MVSTVTSLTLSLPELELNWINRKISVRGSGQCYGQHSDQSDIVTTSAGTKLDQQSVKYVSASLKVG